MLKVEALTRPGVGPISLEIADGACLALMGPSGAGKSLFLRAVVDLDPNEGRVSAGRLERAQIPAPAWRRAVRYLPAESGWWRPDVAGHFADREAALALITALRLPRASLDWQVDRLSSGERQRLALARALIDAPPVLLLDEPTAALDAEVREAAEDLLRAQVQAGTSILLVTHDAEQAGRLAGRIVRMREGRLEGSP
jgi:phosphate-transporting ATPase